MIAGSNNKLGGPGGDLDASVFERVRDLGLLGRVAKRSDAQREHEADLRQGRLEAREVGELLGGGRRLLAAKAARLV